MKKTISILILGALPVLASAGGDHAGGHGMNGGPAMEMQHGSNDTRGMSRNTHDADVGRPGDPNKVGRIIEVTLDDAMRFSPSEISVKAGETVRFFLKNTGKMNHAMVIGSMDELKEHAEMMRKMPDMKHAEPNMITLAPGQRGELVWQFDQPGTVDFACLVPGHMEAGMVGKVEVE